MARRAVTVLTLVGLVGMLNPAAGTDAEPHTGTEVVLTAETVPATTDPDGDETPEASTETSKAPAGLTDLTAACEGIPTMTFTDRAYAGVHGDAVDCLAGWRVATGYQDGTFRPAGTVTRGQMASFVSAAILSAGGHLPAPGRGFSDAAGSVHARPIARLAQAGIVQGYGDGTFRPGEPVLRGQVTTFVVGALDLLSDQLKLSPPPQPAPASDNFVDVAGTTHAATILRAVQAGVTDGFPDGTFRPGEPVIRGQMASLLARLLSTVVASGGTQLAAYDAIDRELLSETICQPQTSDVTRAERFMEGRYHFGPHPEVVLGTDLSWDEDPLQDSNWRFQLHAMRWLRPLIGATAETGDPRFLDHAYAMARDWVRSNPFDAPAGDFAWNDHSTAWRAQVFGCLEMQGPPPPWLTRSLAEHRDRLADPDFYVHHGNHALNQDSGMLAAACLTHAWDVRDLAMERIGALVHASVDREGVSNEQSVEYQDYNYGRYVDALTLGEACGVPKQAWAERIELMPLVLTHMTQPDDTYTTLGDTDRRDAKYRFDHPNLRWMSTSGQSGVPPDETFVTYDAGFTFARSGWGTERDRLDENFLSVRHGEPRQFHGHVDHGSITLFADGQLLIADPGKFRYSTEPQRQHIISAEAHNLVTIGSNCPASADRRSEVTRVARNSYLDRFSVRVATCPGTGWTRTLAFLRATGEVIVVDEIRDNAQRNVVQRWQLEVGADVEIANKDRAHARWPSGATLLVEQLVPVASTTSVRGATSPWRGWVSERYGELTPAANLAVTADRRGSNTATFVTVLRPGVGANAPASTLKRSADTTTIELTTADGRERTVTLPRLSP